MRRALALSLLGLVGLAPVVHAAPTSGPVKGAEVDFRLVSGGRSYDVTMLLTTPSGGSPQLRMRVLDGSTTLRRLSGDLPASAVTTKGGDGITSSGVTTLRTRVGTLPLTVEWRADPGFVGMDYGRFDSDDHGTQGWNIVGSGGAVRVTVGTARCTIADGLVGQATTVESSTFGLPLSRGFGVPTGRGTTCRPVPSTSLPTVP